ncbi:MAG: YidC/Oxa1 family membrane protein insertase [Verrucomicrobiota bacterium]
MGTRKTTKRTEKISRADGGSPRPPGAGRSAQRNGFRNAFPFSFFGINGIHPLPIVVTTLMAVMMRMTPQIGDPQQQKIAQFMPLVFLFIFYNFAAALSLYYVFNNIISIVQIYRNLKKPMPELKRRKK